MGDIIRVPAATPLTPHRSRRSGVPLPAEPLWREALGAELRAFRHRRGETLAEVAARAGVSPQYLSEVERGLKEPSSEMLAAIGGALGVQLIDLTHAVTTRLLPRAAQTNVGRGKALVLALAA